MKKDITLRIADIAFEIQALKYVLDTAKQEDKLSPFYNIVLGIYNQLETILQDLNNEL